MTLLLLKIAHDILSMQPLNNFQNDYYGDSMDWQTRWRIVILACLFGLVMLFALLGGICSVVGRTPRTTAAATFLLWLLTAALLIVGAGEPLCWVMGLQDLGI